jgi:fucose permease
VAIASWVTRTPDIRDLLGASTAEMGLILFGLSVGSMIGILASGRMVARWGARIVIRLGAAGVVLSLPTIAWGSAADSAILVGGGLFLFGAGMGSAEVAMNVEGADVERATGRSFLPMLHGCFSLGTVIGAVAGIVATATDVPVPMHLLIVALLAAIAVLWAIPQLPTATGRVEASPSGAPRVRTAVWRDSRLLLIGVVILAMALAEGTANDWLPLVMVDGHGLDPAYGSAVYAAFAAAMTLGRFVGGWFVDRFGRPAVLCASAVSGVAGLACVIFSDDQVVAGVAVILWGLGAALGFPVAISAAGDSGPDPAARVSFVATVGYFAFLVGPPALGFVGEEFGLRSALLIPLAALALAAIVAPFLRTAAPSGEPVSAESPARADRERAGDPSPQGSSPTT